MSDTVKSLKTALLTIATIVLVLAAAPRVYAADLVSPHAAMDAVPAISAEAYLDRAADLMLLRLRFAALLETEAVDQMRTLIKGLDDAQPSAKQLEALHDDLTSELQYYTVNLKYLIWAEGAIWPADRPEADYRRLALDELATISGELARGNVLTLDVDVLLRRLETVNAWTEGLDMPVDDWFDPARRDKFIEDARGMAKGPTRT